MIKFSYKAMTQNGEPHTGFIEAPSETRALQILQKNNWVILNIKPAEETEEASVASRSLGRRITTQQIMEFSSETSTLLDAGIPLERVLKTQVDLCSHAAFKAVLTDVWKDVNSGASFADALTKHPKVFERFYSSMVRGGEISGTINLIMQRLTALLERRQKLRAKVINALIYPSLLIVVGIGVVSFMMLVMIPKLSALFSDNDRLLPASTQTLIAMSDFARSYWWISPLLILLGFIGYKLSVRTEEGKIKWGLRLLRIPILGAFLIEAETSRFCRMLNALIEGQVPILQALSISGGTLENAALRNLMKKVYETVQGGKPMGTVLQKHSEFPELAARMISMGEESGELSTMLRKVAERYEEKVANSTERFVSVLEPIFIIVLGIIVGFIVISMMQGIMAMSTSAG